MGGAKRGKKQIKNEGAPASPPSKTIKFTGSDNDKCGGHKALEKPLVETSNFNVLALACALTGFLLYINAVWECGFCYDDSPAIQKNPDVLDIQGDGIMSPFVELWKHDFWGVDIRSAPSNKSYRPLVVWSFRMNAWISREPWIFHLTNAVLFGACCWLIVNVILSQAIAFKSVSTDDAVMTVLLSGLWFASHPVHTEAVASIVGRAEVMAAIFCLSGTKLFYSDEMRFTKVAGVVASFFLACLCKETAVVLPTILGATDVVYAIVAQKRSFGTKTRREILMRATCVSMTSALYLWFRVWLFGDSETGQTLALSPIHINFVGHLTHMNKLRTAIYIQAKYVKLLVWPGVLSCDYNIGVIEPVISWMTTEMAFSAVVAVAIIAWLLLAMFRLRRTGDTTLLLALGWTFGPLIPASHIVGIGTVMAERLAFLPSIGGAMLICHGLTLMSNMYPKGVRKMQNVLVICIVCFAYQTVTRNPDWADNVKLFTTDLKSHPESVKLLMSRASYDDLDKNTAFEYATAAQRVLDRNAAVLKHAPYPHALRVMVHLKSKTDTWPEGANHTEVVLLSNRIIAMGNQFGIPEWGWIHEKKGRALVDLYQSSHDQSLLKEAVDAFQIAVRYKQTPSASLFCLLGSILTLLGRDLAAHESYENCFRIRETVGLTDRQNHAIVLMRLSGVKNNDTTAVKKWGQAAANEVQKLIDQLQATGGTNVDVWVRKKNEILQFMHRVAEKEKSEILNLVNERG